MAECNMITNKVAGCCQVMFFRRSDCILSVVSVENGFGDRREVSIVYVKCGGWGRIIVLCCCWR